MWKGMYKKPKAIRQLYAFWYAAGITSVIALVWVVSLEYRLTAVWSSSEQVIEEVGEGAFSQFMGDAKDNFANVFSATEDTETPPPAHTDPPAENDASNVRGGFLLEPQTNPVMQINENARKRSVLIGTTTTTANTR